jgi:hypothetical protein
MRLRRRSAILAGSAGLLALGIVAAAGAVDPSFAPGGKLPVRPRRREPTLERRHGAAR